MSGPPRDPWFLLSGRTPARIALGRSGVSIPTREVLSFALAHAQARDAVHARLQAADLLQRIAALGLSALEVHSDATDRQTYLRRPDLGRKLSERARKDLEQARTATCDLSIVIGDGLSATAVSSHAADLLEAFLPATRRMGLTLGPVVVAHGARVALGDDIANVLAARCVAVLIGERPGLSSADSIGVYLTYSPRPGRTDGERNCISNIRPGGLAIGQAAARLAWLVEAALVRKLTGVALKDESDTTLSHDARVLLAD